MDKAKILHQLSHNSRYYPKDAVIAAEDLRSELEPVFIEELRNIADDQYYLQSKEDGYFLHIYSAFFLAKWQTKQAFPILLKIFSQDTVSNDYHWGDVVTEDLHSLIASVYTDELDELEAFMRNPSNGEYERSAIADAFVTLYVEGIIDRETAVEKLRSCLEHYITLNLEYDYLPSSLASKLANLHPSDSMSTIKKAFEHGLVDPMSIRFENVEEYAEQDQAELLNLLRKRGRNKLVTSVVDELGGWACFRSKEKRSSSKTNTSWGLPQQPHKATEKVGRNDHCPCGSGKNYKKCCLQ